MSAHSLSGRRQNPRAFTTGSELVHEFARVDRELWDCLLGLDEAALDASLGQWLTAGKIRGMLRRRDVMAEKIEKMVDDRGPQDVFVRYAANRIPTR
jgi:hypothetical protein